MFPHSKTTKLYLDIFERHVQNDEKRNDLLKQHTTSGFPKKANVESSNLTSLPDVAEKLLDFYLKPTVCFSYAWHVSKRYFVLM